MNINMGSLVKPGRPAFIRQLPARPETGVPVVYFRSIF